MQPFAYQWLLNYRLRKSKHSLTCIALYLRHLRDLVKGSHHTSAVEQNLCAAFFVQQAEPFFKTVSLCTLPE